MKFRVPSGALNKRNLVAYAPERNELRKVGGIVASSI